MLQISLETRCGQRLNLLHLSTGLRCSFLPEIFLLGDLWLGWPPNQAIITIDIETMNQLYQFWQSCSIFITETKESWSFRLHGMFQKQWHGNGDNSLFLQLFRSLVLELLSGIAMIFVGKETTDPMAGPESCSTIRNIERWSTFLIN